MKIPIKQSPEDFIVEEIISFKTQKQGKYLYAKITKINLNTLDVVNILQNKLNIPRKFISFAGTKDKRAVTSQHFSIKNIKKETLGKLTHPNIKTEFIGYSNTPITLGSLTANRFTITLNIKPNLIKFIPNYFGEQRFSKNNADVGKAIIKKDFKQACSLIENSIITAHLNQKPNDFIGAIKTLDKKLISLYINAYQSYLWNNALKEYLKQTLKPSACIEHESLIFPKIKIKNIKIPLISFDTEFKNKAIKNICTKLLQEENIALNDFIIRQFPDQLPITTERNILAEVRHFSWKNNKLKFQLPKGSYATTLIKQIESLN